MDRKYHPYWDWEDFKNGFYNSFTTKERGLKRNEIIKFFCDETLVTEFMNKVTLEWVISCEQNLTNTQMNRIAWLGQAASLLYCGAVSELTMETWKYIPEENQEKANRIAE